MRILVVTTGPWRNDENIGNTMTNFFCEDKKNTYYSLYFRGGNPNNNISSVAFGISDRDIIFNPFGIRSIGKVQPNSKESVFKDTNLVVNNRDKQGNFLWFLRELFWKINFNSKNLDKFLDDIHPDIVFFAASRYNYIYALVFYIIRRTGAKLVTYYGDDHYLLSNDYTWLSKKYRKMLCKKIEETVRTSALNYCSSSIHAAEYNKIFNVDCDYLIKGHKYTTLPEYNNGDTSSIKFLYTGGLYIGRAEALAKIGKSIDKYNEEHNTEHKLIIYSGSLLTEEWKTLFSLNSIVFKGFIKNSEIEEIQRNADVLVHVESLTGLEGKFSFSTKISDYLNVGKCIFAFGGSQLASIRFLQSEQAAVVACSDAELDDSIERICCSYEYRKDMAQKAWNVGCSKANIDRFESALYKRLEEIQ